MHGKQLTNEEKLNEIYEMVYENHQILKMLRRQQYMTNAFRIVYWLAILGALGGVYYYVRPVVAFISGNSGKFEETMSQFNQLRGQLPEGKVLNQFLEGMQKSVVAPPTDNDSLPQANDPHIMQQGTSTQ